MATKVFHLIKRVGILLKTIMIIIREVYNIFNARVRVGHFNRQDIPNKYPS